MSKKSSTIPGTIDGQAKAIIKVVEKHIYSYGANDLFYDFIDYCMWMLSGKVIKPPKKYTDKQVDILHQMFLGLSDIEPYEDPLGAVYEYLVSSSKASALGQFFTPMHICEFMSQLIMGTPEPYKHINGQEPASGSGRNVLAFMKHFRKTCQDQQIPGASATWWCIDLDPLCAKMTVINCMLNDIPAVVFHGDTLAMKMYNCYTVSKLWDNWCPIIVKQEGEKFDMYLEYLQGSIGGLKTAPEPPKDEQVTLFTMDEEKYHETRAKQPRPTKKTGKADDDSQLSLF